MKLSNRTLFILTAVTALVAAGSSFWAGEAFFRAGRSAEDARSATFQTYRVTQSLKALTAGYELTMNEYYSTVLKFPTYQKKADAQQAAIASELSALAALQTGDRAAVGTLTAHLQGMARFRADLEKSLISGEEDWDAAREALFKLNVLSVQAIQQADFLGESASQRAVLLDQDWQARRTEAAQWQRVATGLVLLACALLVYGALRARP